MTNWHGFIPAGILAGGCVLLFGVHRQAEMPLRSALAELPRSYQEYTSKDRTVSDDEQRVAGMDSYIMRVFERDSLDQFSVYVGYYKLQYQGHTAHSPKNCLPGSGWEPLNQRTAVITTADGARHEVNRYLLMKGTSVALVYYWYQGRGRVAWDEYQVKWDLLRDAAIHGRTEEALVRIVVPVYIRATAKGTALDEQAASADSLATSIAQTLIPQVAKVLPVPMT
jgi:EpsI family protein